MPRIPLPDKFSHGDFSAFKKSFNRVAAANSWTDEEKLSVLPLCLHGRALATFEKHEPTIKSVEDAFIHLTKEFEAAADKERALKEFYSCAWGYGLDLDLYAKKLSDLLRRGLSSLDDDDHNRIVTNQFVNGFPSDLRDKLWLVFAGRTPLLTDAVAAARDVIKRDDASVASCAQRDDALLKKIDEFSQKLEAVTGEVASISSEMRAAKFRSGGSGPSNQTQAGRDYPVRRPERRIRCFNCSGLGHIARDCPSPSFKRSATSGNGAAVGRRPTPNPQ